jgi:hypothetical protein
MAALFFNNLYRYAEVLVLTSIRGFSIATGQLTEGEYLSHARNLYPNPPYRACRFLANLNLPPDARVLFVGESRTLYSPAFAIANAPHDVPVIYDWAQKAGDSEKLARVLQEQHIAAVLVNPAQGVNDSPRYATSATKELISKTFSAHFHIAYSDEYTFVLLPNS